MLIEVDKKEFISRFDIAPHPFLENSFIELNEKKVEQLVYLIQKDQKKIQMGLIAGIKNGDLISPFSAPFGGFHFRHHNILSITIDSFVNDVKKYIVQNNLRKFSITFPPQIYHESINSKIINAMLRMGFELKTPEITCWVDLHRFNGNFSDANIRRNYRKAVSQGLSFKIAKTLTEKQAVYNLINNNRKNHGRPIYMTFSDILNTTKLWPIDFFQVFNEDHLLVAAAIFYRSHKEIIHTAFMGDTTLGRSDKSMSFLALKSWNHYKNLGYQIVDLGTATELGVPNEGLLRFKECHEAISSLRFSLELVNLVHE